MAVLIHSCDALTVLQTVLGARGGLVDGQEFPHPCRCFISTETNAQSTDNSQEPRYDQERKSRGQLRLFPDFFAFLEDEGTANPSPNAEDLIALTNLH